jgi:hypothetical protein
LFHLGKELSFSLHWQVVSSSLVKRSGHKILALKMKDKLI